MKAPKNISASVRERLLNRAKKDNRPFNELLQYYAIERFLYRLSQSKHADRFVLKGALMLRVWRSPEFRPMRATGSGQAMGQRGRRGNGVATGSGQAKQRLSNGVV